MTPNEERFTKWTRRLAYVGLGIIVLSTLLFRTGILDYTIPLRSVVLVTAIPLGGVALATIISLIAILVGAVALVLSLRSGKLNTSAAVGVLIAISVAIVPVMGFVDALTHPLIHDVSTDLENPLRFEAVLDKRPASANALETSAEMRAETTALQKQGYPHLAPLMLGMTQEKAFDLVLANVKDMGWEIISAEENTGIIEAVASTQLFGFQDDVILRVQAQTGYNKTRVDMRSVSRVGESDLGANAKRIAAFLAQVDAAQ